MSDIYLTPYEEMINGEEMAYNELVLTPAMEQDVIKELVSCFNLALSRQEVAYKCMTRFTLKFSKLSYNSPPDVSEFAIQMLRLATVLFQECFKPQEMSEKSQDALDPEEKSRYLYQLKQSLLL